MEMKGKITEKQPSLCNCLNLRRASLAITKIYDQWLAPSGLTINQFGLLKHIKFLGPVSVSDLSLEIRLDRTTLVRNLKPLEKEGLIMDLSKKGTRNRQLQLSRKGTERLKAAELLWMKAQNFIEEHLGEENIKKMTELLSMIEGLPL